MKKLNLILTVFVFLIAGEIFGQGMTPPEPIKSPFIDAAVGTWVSEPYDMMGTKMTEEVTHTMILNGQFMEVDVKSVGDNGFVYQAKGIVSPSADGTLTGWFFDIFGKDGMATYTGTTNGSTVDLSGTGSWGTEKRVINIDGNKMTHDVTMDMKDMPQQKMTISFKRK